MNVLAAVFMFVIAILAPWYVTALAALPYVLWRPAYELICIGIIVDAVFGAGVVTFNMWYTLGAFALVAGAEVLKPHLAFHNDYSSRRSWDSSSERKHT